MPKESISTRTRNGATGARAMRDQQALYQATQEDLATLRTKFNALLAKLDADAGVTDVNYTATCNVPVQNLQP